jgi:S-adenosylmethionine decarboxylase
MRQGTQGAEEDHVLADTNRSRGIGVHADSDASRPPTMPDYFVERNGRVFAGTHLLIDFWGAEQLDNLDHVEKALTDAVIAAGATLLHIHLHRFPSSGGISGVAILAESHITIHTWPERGYIALDVFMCGRVDAQETIPVLQRGFRPMQTTITEVHRGLQP